MTVLELVVPRMIGVQNIIKHHSETQNDFKQGMLSTEPGIFLRMVKLLPTRQK